jgi:hypothetical protein
LKVVPIWNFLWNFRVKIEFWGDKVAHYFLPVRACFWDWRTFSLCVDHFVDRLPLLCHGPEHRRPKQWQQF